MMRYSYLCFLSLLLAAPAMAEAPVCELQSANRGQSVQSYVPSVLACLENPRQGFNYDRALEQEMFNRVNAERAARGLKPLVWRAELMAPARVHSFDMGQEGFFAHRGVDGRSAFQRIAALDRTLLQSETRENLAALNGFIGDTDVASTLHTLLMESEAHRGNILAPTLTHMAIGIVRSENGVWVTQIFVRQGGTLVSPAPLTRNPVEAIAIEAELAGRELYETFLLGERLDRHTPSVATPAPIGDLQLMVVGAWMTSQHTRHTMTLNGPIVSIVP